LFRLLGAGVSLAARASQKFIAVVAPLARGEFPVQINNLRALSTIDKAGARSIKQGSRISRRGTRVPYGLLSCGKAGKANCSFRHAKLVLPS